jgi:hypothetical protein
MERESNDVRFDGQAFYLGLDVRHKSRKVTIRTMGIEVKTMVMPPDPLKLYEYMKRNYPGGALFFCLRGWFQRFLGPPPTRGTRHRQHRGACR